MGKVKRFIFFLVAFLLTLAVLKSVFSFNPDNVCNPSSNCDIIISAVNSSNSSQTYDDDICTIDISYTNGTSVIADASMNNYTNGLHTYTFSSSSSGDYAYFVDCVQDGDSGSAGGMILISSSATTTNTLSIFSVNTTNSSQTYDDDICTIDISYTNGTSKISDVSMDNYTNGLHTYELNFSSDAGDYFYLVSCNQNGNAGAESGEFTVSVSSTTPPSSPSPGGGGGGGRSSGYNSAYMCDTTLAFLTNHYDNNSLNFDYTESDVLALSNEIEDDLGFPISRTALDEYLQDQYNLCGNFFETTGEGILSDEELFKKYTGMITSNMVFLFLLLLISGVIIYVKRDQIKKKLDKLKNR